MRKSKEIIRLHHENQLTNRQIARTCQVSRSTVADYLARAKRAGLHWPLPEEWNEEQLEAVLFPTPTVSKKEEPSTRSCRPLPDMVSLHRELHRKHVTLKLLWEEYRQEHADGLQYSQFCEHYQRWNRHLSITMRQEHKAGDKLFVDYAGMTIPVHCRETGTRREAYLFVAVLGASSYTYAEATWSQALPSWIASHVRALEYIRGVPACLVPDNLRSGVTRACRYEPDLNPTYQAFAEHYGTAVLPARPRKPRDKAKVEVGVLLAERWILAALRHHTFLSLSALNGAIAELLKKLNQRKFQRLDVSRSDLYEQLDRPALRDLPRESFHWEQIKMARVNIDHHVDVDGHFYSVPYTLHQEAVEVRLSDSMVEILHQGQRVASHPRSYLRGRFTTREEHRPKNHQVVLQWTPERLCNWGRTIGPSTAAALETIIAARPYPEQGYRSCLGVLRLADRFGKERLEAACHRAVDLQICSFRSIRSMLEKGLDRPETQSAPESAAHREHHPNVRGAAYYQGKEAAYAATTKH